LLRLGPQFTFETRVTAGRPPDADGCIRGPLRLVGGGDPNLSARAVPYQPEPARAAPAPGYALAALAELAGQVAAKGVKCIDGDIVGDDTWYVWEPTPRIGASTIRLTNTAPRFPRSRSTTTRSR